MIYEEDEVFERPETCGECIYFDYGTMTCTLTDDMEDADSGACEEAK